MTKLSRLLGLALITILVAGCGTNPVTGKRELQLVSEDEEKSIGALNYAPTRQAQGGDYLADPKVAAYVRKIGMKLAAVSDRKLDYEFVVLNNSVPNAWAMPGGKIAVNRGLLVQLRSEAELAAVLGHEIVHAAARHSAKGMERTMITQAGMSILALSVQNQDLAQAIVGGAGFGANLITAKFGRDDESEADYYGMIYMQRAGYDLHAAVELQETLLRLSGGKEAGWLDGLLASHPASAERVEANKKTLAELKGKKGKRNAEEYAAAIDHLREKQTAYDNLDRAAAAHQRNNPEAALRFAQAALAAEPNDARIQEMMGDVLLARNDIAGASQYYRESLRMDKSYFKPHLQLGLIAAEQGNRAEAEQFLNNSVKRLPTAMAHYALGLFAEERGETPVAVKHFQSAAESDSPAGKLAAQKWIKLELPARLNEFVVAKPVLTDDGKLALVVTNATPVPLAKIGITVAILDKTGRVAQGPLSYNIDQALGPQQEGTVVTGFAKLPKKLNAEQIAIRIDSAKVVQAK
jgi:predicted Zn-dependent protease